MADLRGLVRAGLVDVDVEAVEVERAGALVLTFTDALGAAAPVWGRAGVLDLVLAGAGAATPVSGRACVTMFAGARSDQFRNCRQGQRHGDRGHYGPNARRAHCSCVHWCSDRSGRGRGCRSSPRARNTRGRGWRPNRGGEALCNQGWRYGARRRGGLV